ncbi:MAG TPA: peptidoglycan editing factor PgeF [Terracidiphilus sp.]|jgi:YfiH family protein|nr:peptidoglycan editing factor PgeF [Terracidiphilus sp.]
MDRAMPEELAKPAPNSVIAPNGVHLLQISEWNELPWLWHGFSTRRGGVSRAYCAEGAPGELNLGFTAHDDRDLVIANRSLLAAAVSGDPTTQLVTVRQFHSNLVVAAPGHEKEIACKDGAPGDMSSSLGCKGDGLITAEPGLLLAIQTADCIPVLLADRKQRVVAAFHAGWRGTVQRIVELGVGKMRLEFGSKPRDLIAAIGPGIGACCYAIGEEVLSAFESQFTYGRALFHEVFDTDPVRTKYPMLFLTQRAPGHSPIGPSLHLDLIEANRRQLLDAGVKPGAIRVVGGCTNCRPDLFFSHRASQGHAGRMMSVIGLRPRSSVGNRQKLK